MLDLGCGTGTLLLLTHGREPRAAAFGLDGDPKMAAAPGRTVLRAFDDLDSTRDNAQDLLPRRMEEAGFENLREVGRIDTLVVTVAYYRRRRPPDAHR